MESLSRFQIVGDTAGMARALVWVGLMSVDEPEAARHRLCDEGIEQARRTGDPWTVALCLKIGSTYLPREDLDPAAKVTMAEEAIALAKKAGDPYLVAETIHGMGDVLYFLGDHGSAERWFRESMERAREAGYRWLVCDNLWQLAQGCADRGRVAEAKDLYREGLRLAEGIGDRGHYIWFLRGLAQVYRREGRTDRCLRLGGAASALGDARATFPPQAAAWTGVEATRAAALAISTAEEY